MTSISGILSRTRQASILAATKAVTAQVRHADAVREDHDRTAKTVTAAPALDEARANPSLIDTYESDDTFAHTELMKARGGRLDLIV
jgi:hypothetical protein